MKFEIGQKVFTDYSLNRRGPATLVPRYVIKVVYRSLNVLGGGRSKVVRTIEIGVLYEMSTLDWDTFPDLTTWWASLKLGELDQRFEKAFGSRS